MSHAFHVDVDGHRLSGRIAAASSSPKLDNPPLIVALHGGGFTSAYFDSGEFSLLDRASAAGCPSIALDRPGHGSSTRLADGARAVARNADVLQSAIARIWHERDFDAQGVVLVGHSVGGGVANYIASSPTDWPLLGIAVSGIFAATPTNVPPFWEEFPPSDWIETPLDVRLGSMLGPSETYSASVPELFDGASAPLWTREAIEMFTVVPGELADTASRIRVPVLCHLDDLAAVGGGGQEELELLSGLYKRASSVTIKLVPNAGHCIDFHAAGAGFQQEQIDFAIDCASNAGAIANPVPPPSSIGADQRAP